MALDMWNNIPIIADDTTEGELYDMADDRSPNGKKGRGYLIRDFLTEPLGKRCRAADPEKITDPSEYDAIIDEQDARESSLQHINEFFKVLVKDQDGTSNCWANAPCGAVELKYAEAGLPPVDLSPGYIASVVGAFDGGLGLDAYEVFSSRGVCETSFWDANKNSTRGVDDQKILANAARFKVAEFRDLPSRDSRIQAHHSLQNRPLIVGLNWWGHEVQVIRFIRVERGRYGWLIKNSWGAGWGNNGVGVLDFNKGLGDDCQVLIRVNPFAKAA